MKHAIDVNMDLKAISGWVSRKDENENEQNIVVTLRGLLGFVIAKTKCNIQRDDVRNAGLHDTGMCGFRFYADDVPLQEGNFYIIEIANGKSLICKNIMYGNTLSLMKQFNRFELERDDFIILDISTNKLFSEGNDLINFKKLLIRLRRGKRAKSNRGEFVGYEYPYIKTDWKLFKNIVQKNINIIFQNFDSRYLWSIVDTFADYGNAVDRLAALSVSNWMAQERCAQTYKCIFDFKEKEKKILNTQFSYWGGMQTNRLSLDDSYDIFITRSLECLQESPLIRKFYVELLLRSMEEEDSILGFNMKYSKYFSEMAEFYKRKLM